MNKHAIRYAMLGRVRFDVHPGTFWPSQVRFDQGAFGRGYVLTRYRPQLLRNLRTRRRFDSSSIIAHPVNFDQDR